MQDNTFKALDGAFVTHRIAFGADLDSGRVGRFQARLEELRAAGITHVLDVRSEWDATEDFTGLAPDLSYRHAGIDDLGQTWEGKWITSVTDWAADVLDDPSAKLYVHCHMGINRAPSVILAILLHAGWDVIAAMTAIREVRDVANAHYAKDVLDWHLTVTHADSVTARDARAALAEWRKANPLDEALIIHRMRGVEESEIEADRAEMEDEGAWLMQVSKDVMSEVNALWDREPLEDVFIDVPSERHRDEIALGDLVFLWVHGPRDTAGVFGVGLVSGEPMLRDHARSYTDPEGPRSERWSVEVVVISVFREPIVRRGQLKNDARFEDFELFVMPRRTSAFAVTPEQKNHITELWDEAIETLHGPDD